MKYRAFICAALALTLSACGKPQATCSDDASKAALESAIREGLEKVVAARSKDDDGNQIVGFSKIRAAIAGLKFVVENIRTTKEDPNSTKKFCTSNIKIVFGTQVFTDADKAREIAGLSNLTQAADAAGIEKGADYLKGDLDYSVQPTDDGSKVIAEFEAADAKLDVFGEVVAASLLRSGLENKQRIDQENAAFADKQRQDAVNAASRSSIEEASIGLKSADDALMAVWKGLDPTTRQQLLPQQRAWIKRKDATCKVQGLQRSTDPTEQRVATLNCITSETQSRIGELQGYLDGGE
jgi:uncharacterized protein YecT (DUF1311 family)